MQDILIPKLSQKPHPCKASTQAQDVATLLVPEYGRGSLETVKLSFTRTVAVSLKSCEYRAGPTTALLRLFCQSSQKVKNITLT